MSTEDPSSPTKKSKHQHKHHSSKRHLEVEQEAAKVEDGEDAEKRRNLRLMDEAANKAFMQAWDLLDNDEEMITIERAQKFAGLSAAVMEKLSKEKVDTNIVVRRSQELQRRKLEHTRVPTGYLGPQLDSTVTESFALGLIKWYERDLNNVLPYTYAERIFNAATEHFEGLKKTLQEIKIPEGGHISIVGDMHGQYPDFLTLLTHTGLPSDKNYILFNGDIVDRGPQGPQLLLSVYALKLAYPAFVFVNRGNHEMKRMNRKYKFEDQVREMYGQEMMEIIAETYKWLPLCAVIDSKIFVTHGGLARFAELTLDYISKMPSGAHLPHHKDVTTIDQEIRECLLWSDPETDVKEWKRSNRGAGILWGKQLTQQFLERNNLAFMIRSHQVKSEGFERHHDNLALTIFSASFYDGKMDNQGAIVKYKHGIKSDEGWRNPSILPYYADAASDRNKRRVARAKEALKKIGEKIYEHRQALAMAFQKKAEGKSTISISKWTEALKEAIELPIDWLTIQPYLVPSPGDQIDYPKFLNGYKVVLFAEFATEWQDAIVRDVCHRIFTSQEAIKAAFTKFDANGDGKLSYDEFTKGLHGLNLGLSPTQIFDFAQSIDEDQNGFIEWEEFRRRFDFHWNQKMRGEIRAQLLEKMSSLMVKHFKDLREAYETADKDGNSRLRRSEFTSFLKRKLPEANFTDEEREMLFEFVDADGNGRVNWEEFESAFLVTDSSLKGDQWQSAIMQRVLDCIRTAALSLKTVFRTMDVDESGSVDRHEFQIGIEALNEMFDPQPLAAEQIQHLFNCVDKDKDGGISYEEFLTAFDIAHEDEEDDEESRD